MARHGSSHRGGPAKGKRKRNVPPKMPARNPTSSPILVPRPDDSAIGTIAIINQFAPDDPRSQLVHEADGSPGTYRVTFILSLPGKEAFRGDISFAELMESGDSLLILPTETAQCHVKLVGDNESVEVLGLPNSRHAMSKVQMRVHAEGFLDAARYAHDLIMPLLSRWSFDSDAAIDIGAYEVFEEATGSSHWTLGLLGRDKGLAVGPNLVSTPAMRRLLSSYREGLSATNPLYRVLCFYKVMEGVKKQRSERRTQALAAGEEYREPAERIPEDDAAFPITDPREREPFQEYYGKKFTRVLEDMRDTLRNAVAHLDPRGNSLVADSFEDIRACQRAAPVLKYMAREMLMHESEGRTPGQAS